MRKFIILVSILLMATLAKEVMSNQTTFSKITSSVVSIFSNREADGFGSCSGVVIKQTNNNTYVLTCKHCIGPAKEEMYVDRSKVQGIITRTENDLAIAIVEGKIKDKISTIIANKNPGIKEDIYHLGFPHGIDIPYSAKGKIS